MKHTSGLLALPASLLALTLICGVDSHGLQPPYRGSQYARDYPNNEAHLGRVSENVRKVAPELPVGLKKMGDDPGEKFYLHYWKFGDQSMQTMELDEQQEQNNTERPEIWPRAETLFPPLLQHTNHERVSFELFGRSVFGRDFQCPAGTASCSSVGQSDLCCPNGQTCVATSGGVGCCPSGDTCGDVVATCDTNSGFTSCPGSSDGGCCVPGASCSGSGCVFLGTETITRTAPAKTVTTGVSIISHTTSDTPTATTPTPQVVVSGFTTTATVTISNQGTTQTTTVVIPTTVIISQSSTTSLTSSSTTTTDTDITTSTSTVTPNAPVRGTSIDTESQSTVSAAGAPSAVGCPTGFYMCSAVFLGGCCRVGRNCDTTSCPATDSTAVVESGLTIAAPPPASATHTGGSCATGWLSCAASAGGGCCPTGYICGASCTASVSGVSDLPKETPSKASVDAIAWSFLVLGLSTALAMVWL